MESFITGFLLGLGIAIPIGPLNILIMNYSLSSFRQGFSFGLGAMSADMMFFALLSAGVIATLNAPWIFNSVAIFGTIFLLYMGYVCYKNANKIMEKVATTEHLEGVLPCFLKGFGLNSINPFVIGFWISLSSVVVSSQNVYLSALGVLLSILIWVFGLSFVTNKAKRLISDNLARNFAYISAFLMLVFAGVLVYNTFFKGV